MPRDVQFDEYGRGGMLRGNLRAAHASWDVEGSLWSACLHFVFDV
jgi:hypothetical protein